MQGVTTVGGTRAAPVGSPDAGLWPKCRSRVERLRFRRAPLLFAAVCFALGESFSVWRWQPELLLLGALVLLLVLGLAALRRGLRVAVVPVAGVWAIAGMWCAEVRPEPVSQPQLLMYADGLSRRVEGRVVRVRALPGAPPKDRDVETAGWWETGGEEASESTGATQVDLEIRSIEEVTPDVSRMLPVEGGVRVTLPPVVDGAQTLECGDVVAVPMRLRGPERYRDPGVWQYADYLLEQGIGAGGTVARGRLEVVGREPGSVRCRLMAAQAWAAGRIGRYVRSGANRRMPRALRLSADDAGMLGAMLFGDRSALNHQQRLGFERTGSFHLFVVSGMHVALVAGGLIWMGRRLRWPPWLATAVTLLGTAGYALLTGFGVPVQRALWMTTVFLVARLLSREHSIANAVGAAALAVLAWTPAALFEASFQMTFLAMVAIVGIASPLAEQTFLPYSRAAEGLGDVWRDTAMTPRLAQFRIMLRVWGEALAGVLGGWATSLPGWLARGMLVVAEFALIGTVAEMVMALPMAAYFHRATVFALPANAVSVPLVALMMPISLLAFVGMLAGPWCAVFPATVTALLLHGTTGVIGAISRARISDLRVPGPGPWVVAIALLCWAACCWAVRRTRRLAWVSAGVLPAVLVLVLWPGGVSETAGALEVSAIDVGQGDSLLVVGPEGRAMLVDAGGPVGGVDEAAEATSRFDVGEEVVSAYLWSRRIRRLDVVALSHAHSDHMGGMPAVLRNFRPRELWVGIDPDSAAYRDLLAEARELGVAVRHLRAGEEVPWGGTEVRILSPGALYANAGAPKNDDSLVMQVRYGKGSVLLEGDAELASENAMLAAGEVGPVTLLKVGHHGSRTSTSAAFLAAAAPKEAVVSVGRKNRFGHPRTEVIDRIASAGARLYRTDTFGLTTFLLDRDGGIREVLGASN